MEGNMNKNNKDKDRILLFDLLCSTQLKFGKLLKKQERDVDLDLGNTLRQCALFDVDSTFPGKFDENTQQMLEEVVLPFPVTGVQFDVDNKPLVLLRDTEVDAKGFNTTRLHIEIGPMQDDGLPFRQQGLTIYYLALSKVLTSLNLKEDEVSINVLYLSEYVIGAKGTTAKALDRPTFYNADGTVDHMDPDSVWSVKSSIVKTMGTIARIGDMRRFIVESEVSAKPLSYRRRPAAKFGQKKVFRSLTLPEVHTLGLGQQKDQNPDTPSKQRTIAPHPRRRHKRVLRSPRWGKRQGEVIDVKACWVGPTEIKDRHVIHKVRIDL